MDCSLVDCFFAPKSKVMQGEKIFKISEEIFGSYSSELLSL